MLKNIVVFIDGENISHRHFPTILSYLNGIANFVDFRIYGDWSRPFLNGWKKIALEEGIKVVHQFNTRKNAADFEMVMDAIELLHKQHSIDSFCIVSSDADFANLCLRLRENGKVVIGLGESKAVASYRNCCNSFFALDDSKECHTEQNNKKDEQKSRNNLVVLRKGSQNNLINNSNRALSVS